VSGPLFVSVAGAKYLPLMPGRPARKVAAAAAIAALLGLLVIALPDRCLVNEIGHHRAALTGDLALGEVPRAAQAARFARACGTPPLADPVPGPGAGPVPSLMRGPIERAPYLQKVTDSGAEILWTGEPHGQPLIAVRAASSSSMVAISAQVDPEARLPRGRQYVARLGRLAPATTYCYEVRDGTRRLAGPFGFTTAPAPGSGGPVRIVAFGDMGWRSSDQRAVLARMAEVEFDLVLLAGDIAYPDGRLDQLENNFFAVYAPLLHSAPFFPASGNHDYLTADAAPFRQAFALPENGGPAGRERWYSFDWGDVHVVVLDSERLVPAQAEWLDADLSRTRAAWVIALFHRTPFSSGEHGPDLPARRVFVPILTRHRVSLVVAGHEHHYERFHPKDGVTYLITGGGGRGTRRLARRDKDSAFAVQVAHFVHLVVEADRLRLWAVDASGQTFDTVTLARSAPPAR
jgi:acid phosphatase type 7